MLINFQHVRRLFEITDYVRCAHIINILFKRCTGGNFFDFWATTKSEQKKNEIFSANYNNDDDDDDNDKTKNKTNNSRS